MNLLSRLFFSSVCTREESITRRWRDLLQQLEQQRGMLGNVVHTLNVLRDIELVSQELKELQVQDPKDLS